MTFWILPSCCYMLGSWGQFQSWRRLPSLSYLFLCKEWGWPPSQRCMFCLCEVLSSPPPPHHGTASSCPGPTLVAVPLTPPQPACGMVMGAWALGPEGLNWHLRSSTSPWCVSVAGSWVTVQSNSYLLSQFGAPKVLDQGVWQAPLPLPALGDDPSLPLPALGLPAIVGVPWLIATSHVCLLLVFVSVSRFLLFIRTLVDWRGPTLTASL